MNRDLSPDPFRRIPTRYVPETKADIGAPLRAARTKKGLTVEAAARQTRIPRKLIEALEANRLEEFPAMAYLRGFLKNYCDYLEVDFDPVWELLAADTKPQPAPRPDGGQGQEPSPQKDSAAAPAPEGPSQAAPWALVGALVLGGLALLLLRRAGPEGRASETPPPPAAFQPVSAPQGAALAIQVRQETWISVAVDGEAKFEGRVPQGARQEWTARRAVTLRTADPSSLKLTLNGAPYSLPAPDAGGNYRIESP